MTSGSLVYLFTGDYSRAYISGGTVGHLDVNYEGQVTISGSGFAVDGVPLTGNRLLTSIYGREYGDDPSRVLTGTLANGDPINATFQIGKWASISVVPVPEPSSLLAIGVGFAGMANTKRRK
jgi:hypothetical protein